MNLKIEEVKGDELPTQSCVDDRNSQLFISLSKNNNIELFKNKKSEYWLIYYNPNDKNVPIIAGKDYPCVEFFTHELLHLVLYQNGYDKTIHEYVIDSSKHFKHCISQDTIDAIINNIAHFKMFPKFIELNLDENRFLMNDELTVKSEDIVKLETLYYRMDRDYFDYFIHVFFDLRYCFSKKYSGKAIKLLKKLNLIDNELYKILENVSNIWEQSEGFSNSIFWTNLVFNIDDLLNKGNAK
jgi:hypothetical protein